MSNNNISTRSDSAASTGHEVKFKCLLKINRKDTGGPVYFKWDGERFKTTSETLKLQSGTDYTITLELQPPLELLYVLKIVSTSVFYTLRSLQLSVVDCTSYLL